jgi:16S rRNA C967 or C1407 C5-methylase (RsmB/RsmF family)
MRLSSVAPMLFYAMRHAPDSESLQKSLTSDTKIKPTWMSLPEVQSAILSSSAEYVKPGGVLVYSTCTLRRAENDDVADAFLENHGGFEPCGFSVANISAPRWPDNAYAA